MNPIIMALLLIAGWGVFSWSARRRWKLLRVGAADARTDRLGERLAGTWRFAFAQERMRRYRWAGAAHQIIFVGFIVLLLRTLVLWGRGFNEDFNLWILYSDMPLGRVYAFLKDVFAVLVLLAALVFVYYRVIARLPRMTLSIEGLVILGIIVFMMIADILYDGAAMALEAARLQKPAPSFHAGEPAGSLLAAALAGFSPGALSVMKHAGFWTHSTLVLIFLNLLPYSKHFHIITAVPNVFLRDLTPRGRLRPVADIEGRMEREEPLGVSRIEHVSWKGLLDLYTCTECGRCSDHCPAWNTGKLLSPKQLSLDLRDHLYSRQKEVLDNGEFAKVDLISDVIKPEVLWACTTCRACETECPVFITYVDKIVDMRRHLVMEKGEFPTELQNAFRGLETNSNPWSFPASDRAGWTAGLEVPTLAENPDAEVLYWVGCSASFDDRARKIARATARLLKEAGVNFAILGPEEQCTGDPARRAGNEFLFQALAQANVEVLNNYGADKKKILATCPHCFNTLLNEYPDFGGRYDVVHHADFLLDLVRQGRLKPTKRIDGRVVFHDSCYLGRYNDIYESPRETLRAIPGLVVLEATESRDRGMCCGAGGAQMFKEEEHAREGATDERVNARRTDQLLATQPTMVASACPFCQRMLIDGLAGKGREDVRQLDIAEILWEAVSGE